MAVPSTYLTLKLSPKWNKISLQTNIYDRGILQWGKFDHKIMRYIAQFETPMNDTENFILQGNEN